MTPRVLFICTGNICRSPMAEGYLRAMVEQGKVEVGSAGLGAGDGLPPSRNSVLVMREEGIDISSIRSRYFTAEMASEATHIFGMSSHHVTTIRDYFPEAKKKTFTLREWVSAGLDVDVPDPIGGSQDEYRFARNLIKEAIPSVLQFILNHGSNGLK